MPAEERVGYHVKRVEQELMALKHTGLKPSGLTVPQYTAMVILSEHPGVSAAALARFSLVSPQTMATILTNLEAKGLIVRSPDPYHLNVRHIELTPAGATTLKSADAAAVAIERRIGNAFTDEERETLFELLARCSTAMHEVAAEMPGDPSTLAPFRTGPDTAAP